MRSELRLEQDLSGTTEDGDGTGEEQRQPRTKLNDVKGLIFLGSREVLSRGKVN